MKKNLPGLHMKTGRFIFSLFCTLLLSGNAMAQWSVTGETFSIASPATLNSDTHVNITFNYTKGSANVYIYALPYYYDAHASQGASAPSPLYTAASGSGTGFVTSTSAGKINRIRFQIYSSDNTTLLYEKITLVNYTFLDYNLTNVSFNPPFPGNIVTNQNVNITFNYFSKDAGVRIYALPYNNGSFAPNGAYSGSPLYTNGAHSGSGTFKLTAAGQVDEIRMFIYATDNVTILFQKNIPVNYTFVDYEISNVVKTPSAHLATLTSGERVNISFNYKSKETNVRIYAFPYKNGSFASGGGYAGSPAYPSNTGSGTSFITLNNGGKVDQIRIAIYASNNTTLLYTKIISVAYTFINYTITNVSFSPPSPATVAVNNNVNLTFNYRAKSGNVYIYALPYYFNNMPLSAAYSGSPLYSAATGNGTPFFTMLDPGIVNRIKFRIYASDNATLLYETTVQVSYTFSSGARKAAPVIEPDMNNISSPDVIEGEIIAYPVPASDKLTIKYNRSEAFTYQLLNTNGELIKEGVGNDFESTIEVAGLSNGFYIVKIFSGGQVSLKKVLVGR